jgi:two-component system, sensor histidine kinase LadS
VRWLCGLLAIVIANVASAALPDEPASEPAVLRAGEAYRVSLAPSVRYLRDPARALTVEQAWLALGRGEFKPPVDSAPNFGFSRDVFWLATRIENRSSPAQRWVLAVEQPRLDGVHVWIRAGSTPDIDRELGDETPFATRSHPHRYPNVEFALAPGSTADVLLRVESSSSIQVPLTLYTPNELYRSSYDQQADTGLYYGVLLALLLFNLTLLIATRDRSYLYYVCYVATFGLAMLAFDGTGFQYLWPSWPWWQNAALPFALGGMVAATCAFTCNFLGLEERLPTIARILKFAGFAGIALAFAGLVPMLQYPADIALNATILVAGALVTIAAVLVALQHYRPGHVFLIAWLILIAGGIAMPLGSFGLIPRTSLAEYGVQVASALEMLVLSFALAYRTSLLQAERDRTGREVRESLERRVADNTRDLETAATQLEELNRLLRDISLRDGLTGLYNRRFLDQLLVEAWNASLSRREPLSVMMVDLDRFKNINDRYGHAAGDDCLRVVAARMSRQANTLGAVAARYGGEEFAVVLAGKPREMADGLAELMRAAVAGEPVKTSVGTIAVTISVGLATAVPKKGDVLSVFIKRADQALYEAKRRGRNQVVIA